MGIDKALPNESNSQINWNFIGGLEGNLNIGHQPSKNSGVTIGSGFDLKEKTESSLKDMGFDPDLIDELKPFLSPIGDVKTLAKNIKKIINHPVKITDKYISKFIAKESVRRYLSLCN
jgi:hypothetical protein